jgi:hypothetical protein
MQIPVVDKRVSAWCFGVAAMMTLCVLGMAAVTVRLFKLQKVCYVTAKCVCTAFGRRCAVLTCVSRAQIGLLRSATYLGVATISLPYVVAALTELLIVACGCVMYGLSGVPLTVILPVMLPPIILTGRAAVQQWVRNDYQLLQPGRMRPPVGSSSAGSASVLPRGRLTGHCW